MKENILVKLLKYAVYASAVVPLIIFSQYISPFHFGKVVVFRTLVEIMLALYLALIWRDRSYLPRRDVFFWGFLGFTLAYTITTFTSINIYQSFWGTLERMGGLYSFWHYFIFYLILTSILRTREEWMRLLKITVVVGVLSAFYGFGQRTNIEFFIGSGGRSRIFGTIGNAALFAGYQIINVFIALILGLESKKIKERNFFLVSAALMTLAVFMTVVRGSVLGISLGLFVFALLYFTQTSSRIAKKITFSLLALGIIFAGFGFVFRDSSFVQNSAFLHRLTDFSLKSPTVQTRFWAWEAGLKGWKESPKTMFVGWGPENFNVPFSKHFNPKFFEGSGSETLFDRAHNMFVEVFVTMGLLGFLAYISLFAIIFRSLWRLKNRPETRIPAIGLIAMTFAYVIHNSFIFDTSANLLVFFTALGFISYLYENNARPTQSSVRILPARQKTIAIILCILAFILAYQTNVKTTKANRATTRAIVAGWTNDFNRAIAKYREATSYDVAGRYEYRNRFAQYLLDYSAENAMTSEFAAVVLEAIALEQKNAEENPHDYLPELYLSRLNIILGKSDAKSPYNDKALEHSMRALSYSPTFVRTYYEIAQAYLNKLDYPKAIEMFQRAVDLNPDTGVSYWYLGAANISAGNIDQGLRYVDQAISKGYRLSKENYFIIANLYIKRNDYQSLIPIYQALIKLEPQVPQYHASLAVAYARLGKIDDAVREAKIAAQMDPSFEAEARAFVQQLGRQW